MKSILNKLGYMSKPAMMGIALGAATVAVGIGVITQFTGDKGAGGITGSALGQYGGGTLSSSAANSGAYSREALEASMAAAQAARQQGDSVYSLKGAGDDFYYGKNAAQQQQMAANASGGSGRAGSDDTGDAYRGGGMGGMGGSGISAVDGSNIMDPAAEAAKAAALQKAGAEQAAALTASGGAGNGRLQSAQMAGVSGGAGGSSGGNVTLLGAGAERGSGAQAIPQAPKGSLPNQQGDMAAFKGGRAGAMGGSNMRGGSGGGLGAGQEGAGVGGAFLTSYNRTNIAKGTVMGDAAKGAADAASAFDGNVEAEAIPVGDGNVRQAALDALGSGTDMAPIRQRLQAKGQDITQNVETAKDLQKKIGGKLLLMGLLVGGFCLAIYAGAKAGGFWGYVAAIVATILAVVAIAYIGKEILDLLKKLKDLPYNLGSGHDLMMGVSILTAALCGVALVMAWVKGGAAKKAAEEAAKKAAEEAAKKAAEEAALAAAGEAAGGTAAGAGGAAAGAGGAAASTGGASLATQVGVSVGSNMATTGATQVISADPSTAASVDPTKPLPADATEEQKILWNQLQQK